MARETVLADALVDDAIDVVREARSIEFLGATLRKLAEINEVHPQALLAELMIRLVSDSSANTRVDRDRFDTSRSWFLRNYAELFQRYGGQIVAIFDSEVIAASDGGRLDLLLERVTAAQVPREDVLIRVLEPTAPFLNA